MIKINWNGKSGSVEISPEALQVGIALLTGLSAIVASPKSMPLSPQEGPRKIEVDDDA